MPSTTPENDAWIERKVNVVNRFAEASCLVGRRLAASGTALDEALGVERRLSAAHGGAFPIRISNVGGVGSITVSGLPPGRSTRLTSATEAQYDESMQRSRVTVTVRPQILAAAEEEVAAGRAASLSAWVDQAMEEKVKREELAALLAEMRSENGPATDDEDTWARRVLGL
ncbi:MAG: heme-binding protein [Solirubrobacteraceae bacterium]